MFDGFTLEAIPLAEATLRVRHGGAGPAILLLHGHPRTHITWHRVAPLLAEHHTVVCPDLRGFGGSSKPADTPDHAGSSKRAKARDCVMLMRHLGHERFAVVGHDRGAYTAFRTAMDHPYAVTRLVILDGIPILEHLERCDERFARAWWHWFFFAQPRKPERAILACPLLVLWSLRDDLGDLYGDVLGVWRAWADDLRGRGLACGHHMAEEVPEELARELLAFLGPSGTAQAAGARS